MRKVCSIGPLTPSDRLCQWHIGILKEFRLANTLWSLDFWRAYTTPGPPKPHYTETWDVDGVLDHLTSLGENSQLSLKQLSQKLVVLMALVQASRSSELQALDVRFRIYRPDGVVFTPPSLTKKRNVGSPAKELFFGAYSADRRLCVVQCLRQYEQATLKFRTSYFAENCPLD